MAILESHSLANLIEKGISPQELFAILEENLDPEQLESLGLLFEQLKTGEISIESVTFDEDLSPVTENTIPDRKVLLPANLSKDLEKTSYIDRTKPSEEINSGISGLWPPLLTMVVTDTVLGMSRYVYEFVQGLSDYGWRAQEKFYNWRPPEVKFQTSDETWHGYGEETQEEVKRLRFENTGFLDRKFVTTFGSHSEEDQTDKDGGYGQGMKIALSYVISSIADRKRALQYALDHDVNVDIFDDEEVEQAIDKFPEKNQDYQPTAYVQARDDSGYYRIYIHSSPFVIRNEDGKETRSWQPRYLVVQLNEDEIPQAEKDRVIIEVIDPDDQLLNSFKEAKSQSLYLNSQYPGEKSLVSVEQQKDVVGIDHTVFNAPKENEVSDPFFSALDESSSFTLERMDFSNEKPAFFYKGTTMEVNFEPEISSWNLERLTGDFAQEIDRISNSRGVSGQGLVRNIISYGVSQTTDKNFWQRFFQFHLENAETSYFRNQSPDVFPEIDRIPEIPGIEVAKQVFLELFPDSENRFFNSSEKKEIWERFFGLAPEIPVVNNKISSFFMSDLGLENAYFDVPNFLRDELGLQFGSDFDLYRVDENSEKNIIDITEEALSVDLSPMEQLKELLFNQIDMGVVGKYFGEEEEAVENRNFWFNFPHEVERLELKESGEIKLDFPQSTLTDHLDRLDSFSIDGILNFESLKKTFFDNNISYELAMFLRMWETFEQIGFKVIFEYSEKDSHLHHGKKKQVAKGKTNLGEFFVKGGVTGSDSEEDELNYETIRLIPNNIDVIGSGEFYNKLLSLVEEQLSDEDWQQWLEKAKESNLSRRISELKKQKSNLTKAIDSLKGEMDDLFPSRNFNYFKDESWNKAIQEAGLAGDFMNHDRARRWFVGGVFDSPLREDSAVQTEEAAKRSRKGLRPEISVSKGIDTDFVPRHIISRIKNDENGTIVIPDKEDLLPLDSPWSSYDKKKGGQFIDDENHEHDGFYTLSQKVEPVNGRIILPVDTAKYQIEYIQVPLVKDERENNPKPPALFFDAISGHYVVIFSNVSKTESKKRHIISSLPKGTRIYLKQREEKQFSEEYLKEKHFDYYEELTKPITNFDDLDRDTQDFLNLIKGENLSRKKRVLAAYKYWSNKHLYDPKLSGRKIEDIIADGRGVCRHSALAFLELLRHLDVPARMVIGYSDQSGSKLLTPPGHVQIQYLGEDGAWLRIDPPNSKIQPDFAKDLVQTTLVDGKPIHMIDSVSLSREERGIPSVDLPLEIERKLKWLGLNEGVDMKGMFGKMTAISRNPHESDRANNVELVEAMLGLMASKREGLKPDSLNETGVYLEVVSEKIKLDLEEKILSLMELQKAFDSSLFSNSDEVVRAVMKQAADEIVNMFLVGVHSDRLYPEDRADVRSNLINVGFPEEVSSFQETFGGINKLAWALTKALGLPSGWKIETYLKKESINASANDREEFFLENFYRPTAFFVRGILEDLQIGSINKGQAKERIDSFFDTVELSKETYSYE